MASERSIDTTISEVAIRNALQIYYSSFETRKSVTLRRAAALAGIPHAVAYVHAYLANNAERLGIGMPDTRSEAQCYLQQLQKS